MACSVASASRLPGMKAIAVMTGGTPVAPNVQLVEVPEPEPGPGEARVRTEAAGLNNLMRSIGASIGIAVCTFMLARNIQVNHAEMGAQITRMSVPFDLDRITAFGGVSEAGMRVVDGMVNKQAAMIGYLNDFYMMGLLCRASIPVLFFVKGGKPAIGGAPMQAAAADH